MRDAEPLEEFADAVCHVAAGVSDPNAVRDVARHGHVREEGAFLEDQSDAATFGSEVQPPSGVQKHAVAEDDPPILRRQEAGHRPQDGGLAGSGGSDQGERLPADLQPDGQGEPRQTMPDVDLEDAVHPSHP